jgi:hypothetical protein
MIDLPWTYVGSMVREAEGTEWGEVAAGVSGSRVCGLRDGRWYRHIYKIEQKHIDAAHRVLFSSCKYLAWRALEVGTGAYTLLGSPIAMYPVVRHFAPPETNDAKGWWAAASQPPYTYWKLGIPAVGEAVLDGATAVSGGLPQPGEVAPDNVDVTIWREQVYLTDGADAYVILEPNFYGAQNASPDSLSAEAAPIAGTAGAYYLELDAIFNPSFLLGGLTDAAYYAS